MKDIINKLIIESGLDEKLVVEAIGLIENTAYKEGYENGLKDGRQSGVKASIRAINSIENWGN